MVQNLIKQMARKFANHHPLMSVDDLVQEGQIVKLRVDKKLLEQPAPVTIPLRRTPRTEHGYFTHKEYKKILGSSLYRAFCTIYNNFHKPIRHGNVIDLDDIIGLENIEETGAVLHNLAYDEYEDMVCLLTPFCNYLTSREFTVLMELVDPSPPVVEAALREMRRKSAAEYRVMHKHVYESLGLAPKVYYRALEGLRGKFYIYMAA